MNLLTKRLFIKLLFVVSSLALFSQNSLNLKSLSEDDQEFLNYFEGEQAILKMLDLNEKPSERTFGALINLAYIYRQEGMVEKALKLTQEIKSWIEARGIKNSSRYYGTISLLLQIYEATGKIREAQKLELELEEFAMKINREEEEETSPGGRVITDDHIRTQPTTSISDIIYNDVDEPEDPLYPEKWEIENKDLATSKGDKLFLEALFALNERITANHNDYLLAYAAFQKKLSTLHQLLISGEIEDEFLLKRVQLELLQLPIEIVETIPDDIFLEVEVLLGGHYKDNPTDLYRIHQLLMSGYMIKGLTDRLCALLPKIEIVLPEGNRSMEDYQSAEGLLSAMIQFCGTQKE